jgi:anti-sigma factor (TIGR02949 family)
MSERHDISCEEALRRLFDYLDRELEPHAHGEMEYHLARCRSCFSRAEFERRLKERLREMAGARAPRRLQARVKRLLGKD